MKKLYFFLCLSLVALLSFSAQATTYEDNTKISWPLMNAHSAEDFEPVNITFFISAANITVAPEGMFLAGSFNEWSDMAMTDNGDGNWYVTVPIEPGTVIEYKFKNGPEGWEENIVGDCTADSGNRTLTIPTQGQSLTLASFNACDLNATAPVDPPPPPVEEPMVSTDSSLVTFTVDMALEDSVSTEGMFLAGTFTGWENVAMTDNGDGTWSYTGKLPQGEMLAYKFKNGPTGWEANEVRSCTVEGTLGDRGHTVGTVDEVLATTCFNSCAACFIDVTFVVDPSQLDAVAAEGMFIAGSFNEWTDGAMTLDEATGLWSATVSVSPGTVVEYKFKNGPDGWEDGISGTCTTDGGNRGLTVPETPGPLAAVCFNACVGCNQTTLTVTVDMNQETIAPEGVFIAGSFNGWTDGAVTDNGDGTYSATITVDRNSEIEYKFKNGPDGWEDGIVGDCVNGSGNRAVAVAEEAVSLEAICFNACTTCTEPMVTFTVDMSDVEVAAEGVFLAGSFNEFADMPMTDNGDGTWSVTIPLAPRQAYEYKFKNGPDGWEEVLGGCTVGFSGNREVAVANNDVALPTVCFTGCVGCGLVGVTFTVDMSQENVNAEGVRVAGSFNDWTDTHLTDVGNGIWSGLIGVMPDQTLEFKYKNGPDGWEDGLMGACASENGNRIEVVAAADVAVMQTCFNSCEICMEEPDPDPIGMTTLNIENSCLNDDGTITIRYDLQYNCDTAPGDLSGMDEIGFHSGANNWSSVVDWDAEGAATAVNDGNDVFSVTIDPVAYYGLGSIDELENIMLVFNQGPTVPDEPWGSEGKTDGEGGLGACADIMLVASELRNCSDIGGGGSETASSASLLAAGSCVTGDGHVSIAFDLADNCMDAPGSLTGASAIGFHSGANDWSSVVEWNADGAVTATNDGNDVFSVTIDPAAYYGIALADLTNIFFVFNQGPEFPDDPWASEGKAQGDEGCVDFNVTISELPTCATTVMEVQDLPLTFESENIEYQLFGFGDVIATRIDNPDPSGNGSSKVLSMEKQMGAQTWAGVALPVASTIDFSTSSLMYVRVWSPRADVPFLLKIEDTNSDPDANGNPSVFAEVFANTTVAGAWETLVFDMSTHPDFNAANAYNQVVVFADMNNPGVGETFYVDNIAQTDLVDVVVVAEAQDLPMSFESDNIEYQLFGFGDAIATRIDNPDPSGNGSSKVLSIEKQTGAQTWAGVALPLASTIDLSTSAIMHVTVWSPRADVPFLLKIEDTNSDPDANGNPSVFAEVFANTTVAGAWETLVFDMSTHPAFNAANSYNQVVVFADMNNPGVGETFYVDDITTETLSTSTINLAVEKAFKIAPNPFHTQALVTWENAENETYQVHVLSITGQVVKSYNEVSGESLIISKDQLLPGMYFLNFRDTVGNMGTLKLMVN